MLQVCQYTPSNPPKSNNKKSVFITFYWLCTKNTWGDTLLGSFWRSKPIQKVEKFDIKTSRLFCLCACSAASFLMRFGFEYRTSQPLGPPQTNPPHPPAVPCGSQDAASASGWAVRINLRIWCLNVQLVCWSPLTIYKQFVNSAKRPALYCLSLAYGPIKIRWHSQSSRIRASLSAFLKCLRHAVCCFGFIITEKPRVSEYSDAPPGPRLVVAWLWACSKETGLNEGGAGGVRHALRGRGSLEGKMASLKARKGGWETEGLMGVGLPCQTLHSSCYCWRLVQILLA